MALRFPYQPHSLLTFQRDYEHFVVGTLLPAPARHSFLALRAFNAELATVRDMTEDNELTGRIRIQWWRDTLADVLAGVPSPNPVADALQEAINEHGLRQRWLEQAIDARESNLIEAQPATLAGLEAYAERSCSSMIYLAQQCVGLGDECAEAQTAGRHVGRALGIVNALRSTPYSAAHGTAPLPRDLLASHGLDAADLLGPDGRLREQNAEQLGLVVGVLAQAANAELEAAAAVPRNLIPDEAVPTLLGAVMARRYLDQLRAAGNNPFDERMFVQRRVGLQLGMFWANLTGRLY